MTPCRDSTAHLYISLQLHTYRTSYDVTLEKYLNSNETCALPCGAVRAFHTSVPSAALTSVTRRRVEGAVEKVGSRSEVYRAVLTRSVTATWIAARTRSSSVYVPVQVRRQKSKPLANGRVLRLKMFARSRQSAPRQEDGGGAWTARDGIEAAMRHTTHMPVSDRCVCPPHSPRARSDVG